jgi:hypothetical protein
MVAIQNKARKSLRLRREPAGSVQNSDCPLVIGKKASSFQLLVAIQSAAAK